MSKHTPGPWRVGSGSFVVSDAPAHGIPGSDDVEHYGGHLIAESIAPQNLELIAAAPELLEALEECRQLLEFLPLEYVHKARGDKMAYSEDGALAKAIAAIAKATGGSQ